MIQMKILNKEFYEDYELPKYSTPGSAGVDLRACIEEPIRLGLIGFSSPAKIPTGFCIHIKDPSIAGMIIPRSGTGSKGLVLGNLVGLIDSDYQGEIILSVWNRSSCFLTINPGDRIAQLIFIPVIQPLFEIVDNFEPTIRGEGGFGSTGIN